MIQAALEHGVRRFVHVSSIGVYPERPDGAVISEDDGYDDNTGRGGYTRSKILADQLAFWYARTQSAPITVIRPATIYGPGGKNNLVRVGVKKGRFNIIFGDGGSIMPLVYVDNVVDALVLAARRDEAIGRAYNIVDDDRITQREYIRRMGAALGRPQSTTYLPLGAVRCSPVAPTWRRRPSEAAGAVRRACSPVSAGACRAPDTTRREPRPSWRGSRASTSRKRSAGSRRANVDQVTEPAPESGRATILKSNQSNVGSPLAKTENVGAEYMLLNSILSKGSNKADNVNLPSTSKCLQFPPKGLTLDLATAFICE